MIWHKKCRFTKMLTTEDLVFVSMSDFFFLHILKSVSLWGEKKCWQKIYDELERESCSLAWINYLCDRSSFEYCHNWRSRHMQKSLFKFNEVHTLLMLLFYNTQRQHDKTFRINYSHIIDSEGERWRASEWVRRVMP